MVIKYIHTTKDVTHPTVVCEGINPDICAYNVAYKTHYDTKYHACSLLSDHPEFFKPGCQKCLVSACNNLKSRKFTVIHDN